MGRESLTLDDGKELKVTAAKHSEKRLKFCGHADGISLGESSFLTALSWWAEKPRVMWDIMSAGAGKTEPFVPSAQKSEKEGSKVSERLNTGTGDPIPNWRVCRFVISHGTVGGSLTLLGFVKKT